MAAMMLMSIISDGHSQPGLFGFTLVVWKATPFIHSSAVFGTSFRNYIVKYDCDKVLR